MALDVIYLRLERNIIVALVTGTLSLEATNVLLDVALDLLKLGLGLFLRALDLSGNLVMELLILYLHVVFDLADLLLDHHRGLLNLIIGDFSAQRLNLVANLFDQLAAI